MTNQRIYKNKQISFNTVFYRKPTKKVECVWHNTTLQFIIIHKTSISMLYKFTE